MPYPVIPLAVIAVGMVVATLPLAALLVENVIQAIDPSVTVNALLAKNVLWWFGHPVVYLLLFPAAAIYYYLIPRMAGRPLVAGNVIAIAWAIALVANVLVWAHHVYLDYPYQSVQGALNTAMQPMTFALVLPSALSLYSLGFTIFRSDFKWTGASTALFLGLVGWLLAGLSGIVNATIVFDTTIHNTLWVVGHFHHMALLNIGLCIIGATYAFLPELTGKPLYSDRLAKWHVWLTFLAGSVFFGIWLVQGLYGAPRRFAELPGQFHDSTVAAVPFTFILALAQLLFVYNIVQTVRGAGLVERKRVRWAPDEAMAAWLLAALAFAGGLFVVGIIVGRASKSSTTVTKTVATAPTQPANPQLTVGKNVFASAGCAACHTLAAAHASGTVGPSLDQTKPPAALVVVRVTNGKGKMPSFKGRLTTKQIQAVAAYVAASEGK